MCCWGYGELSKESGGRGGCGRSAAVGWRWGRSLGGGHATETAGKGDGFEAEKVPNPQKLHCKFYSLSSVWSWALRVLQTPAFFLPSSPKTWEQSCRPRLRGGLVGATRWLRGCVDLWEQMGCWSRCGLFSGWDRGGTSPSSMCRKMIWAIAFLPASSRVQQSWERREKEGCGAMGQGEDIWRTSPKNCCGEWIFQLWHLPLNFIKLYVLMRIHPFMCFTPSIMGRCRCHRVCPVGARYRVGDAVLPSRAACHIHPSTQPFLVCHFVMGNVRQLAAQASDCFLVFAFSFIYYSFFLHVLDVCKSSCFELWREHWAWNAWWRWHLGYIMLVFSWAILCMKVESMSQEERRVIRKAGSIAAMGASGSHQSWSLLLTRSAHRLLPIPGQIYLGDVGCCRRMRLD